MNPINAKSVQLIELHAFAYCLLSVSLSESFDYTKYGLIKLLPVFSSNHSLVKFSKPTGNKATGSTSKIRHLLPNLRLNYFRHKFS